MRLAPRHNPKVFWQKTIYRLATLLQLAGIPRKLRAQARAMGAEVRFGWGDACWSMDGMEVRFRDEHFGDMVYFVANMPHFLSRLEFLDDRGRKIADLRGAARYRIPSGYRVWLPGLPETADFMSGYFAKGDPKPGQVVIDAGAYCGEVTIEMAARVGPAGHVFAFEPDPGNLVWLRRNIEESGLRNITVVPKGLWNATTTLQFHASQSLSSSVVGEGEFFGETVSRVEVLSPADVLKCVGGMPDFIKMDIEGAEVEFVEALLPLLSGNKVPRMAIASYHLRAGRMTRDILLPLVRSAGLQAEAGHPEHLTTWVWR